MLARAPGWSGQFEAAARIYIELSLLEPDIRCVKSRPVNKRLQNWVRSDAWVRLTEISPDRPESRLELARRATRLAARDAAQAELPMDPGPEPDHRGALTLLGRVRLATDPEGSLTAGSRLTALDPAGGRAEVADRAYPSPRTTDGGGRGGVQGRLERNPAHSEAWCRSAGCQATRFRRGGPAVLAELKPSSVRPSIWPHRTSKR